jgi:hypothetical protein
MSPNGAGNADAQEFVGWLVAEAEQVRGAAGQKVSL